MINIALIGAGELGSRHLQSLVGVENAKVFVVEPSMLSRDIAFKRVEEVVLSTKAEINFVEDITQLPQKIKFVIIATGAAPRLAILKKLVKHAKVKYLLLEKVLFQNTNEYHEAKKLIDEYKIKTWVNCPRRMFDAYSDLKHNLNQLAPISMRVTGGNWGLACNAIHFIDIFSFLSNSKVLSVDTGQLDKQIYPSRRENYIEFFGCLKIKFDNGHELFLECIHESHAMKIELFNCDDKYCINESNGNIELNNTLMDLKMLVKYQSELSQTVVEQVLNTGGSQLTGFNESCELHIPFINALLSFYNNNTNVTTNILPIT